MNLQPFSQIHYLSREYTLDSLSFVRIHNEFTIFFAKLLRIHCLYREFSENSLDVSRIHNNFGWCFAYTLWIQYVFHGFTMNSLFFSRIHYRFTINFANILWIHLFFANSLPNQELTIFNANSLYFFVFIANLVRIHVLFREFTIYSLFFSRIYYQITDL